MEICVAGWHFHEPAIEYLKAHGGFVVAHREHPAADAVIENVGLEFHCYDWFLKNRWQGGPVFFTHDDNEFEDGLMQDLARLDGMIDQAFVFSSLAEARGNNFGHGRAMFCSARLLARMKADGGFWYDALNTGQISPDVRQGNAHDRGIRSLVDYLRRQSDLKVLVPYPATGLKCGFRGKTGLRLNLGCGGIRAHGFVNIDRNPKSVADRVMDIRHLDYAEGSVEEITIIHVIEHFSKADALDLLRHLHGLLKPGATIRIEAPDICKCAQLILQKDDRGIHGIFGDGGDDPHYWGWTGRGLADEMERIGFTITAIEDGNGHGRPWRDFMVMGKKPEAACP